MPTHEILRVLSEDSILQLRGVAERSPKDLLTAGGKLLDFETLKSNLGLVELDSEYTWDPNVTLLLPTGSSWSENNDLANAKRIFEAFPGLTPSDASDMRIWVTLSVREFSGYTDARWPYSPPGSSEKKSSNSLFIHRFEATGRAKWRNQSISRLWWHALFASRFTDLPFDEAFQALTINSDFPAQLLGRTNTAASWKLAGAVLRAVRAKYSRETYSRDVVRLVLKEIDLLLGRRNLVTLHQSEIDQLVAGLFQRFTQE